MNELKAFNVTGYDHEIHYVIFAETANKAKMIGHGEWGLCNYDYIDLRATRLKDLDCRAGEFGSRALPDGEIGSRIMRGVGWYQYDSDYLDECKLCGLYQWDDVPESEIGENGICVECSEAPTNE